MNSKVATKDTTQQLRDELQDIKSHHTEKSKTTRLKEIAKGAAEQKQWDLAMDSFQCIADEKERNLCIADIIEEHLLPLRDVAQAKKFAKFLTPTPELQTLLLIRIALAEGNGVDARQLAEKLPSPLSRNYAYQHIIEAYLTNKEKAKADEFSKAILDNARTIYDAKTRSFVLRDIAINLYLASHEVDKAKEAANLIPDETIRNKVLSKIK